MASRPSEREPEDRRPGGRTAAARASSWRWGELSGGRAISIVVAAAALGAIATLVARTGPGLLLGAFIVVGVLIAGFAVRRAAAYLLIPVPVLAYLVFALAAGLLRNHHGSSRTDLTVSAAQWVANGFLAMIVATVLISAIAVGRWLPTRRAGAAPGAGRRRQGGRSRPGTLTRSRPGGRPEGRRPEGRPEPERRPRPETGGRPRPAFHPNPDYVEWPGERRPPAGPARD
ncbi:MAG TPA: DUF6542 domain-containing protein [Streptosporangiaceae bacterium]